MKQHYDVCIAGFWYGSNYGSLLNGYAMYRILKDLGKEVLMMQKPGATENDQEIKTGHNVRFVKKYYDNEDISPILSYEKLPELNEVCDCFCAGSDQIWNYNLSFHENLYLPFVQEGKKLISFSTSFGHKRDKTPEEAKPRIKKYLQRYNAISVREQFDVDILHNNYGLKSTLLFEPVFCLDKKYYTDLAKNASFEEKEPYLLTYILDPTPEKREAIQFYGEKMGIKVVNILNGVESVWNRNKNLLNLPNVVEHVEAEDFLKAFMNASYVITDSFHGSAFSIIFNKPFLAIGNYGRGYERFIDLLGRLKLLDRLVTDPKNIPHDENYLKEINYDETNTIIQREAKRTVDWVKKAIETPIENMNSVNLPGKAVTTLLKKDMCMGCGACVSCCPTEALTLKSDDIGYYRSTIDYDKCVDCGKCADICPSIKLPEKVNNKKPKCFEFIAADEQILYNSSSGGVFQILAEQILSEGGCVVGASWTNDFSVKHIIIDDAKDLHKLQKSKYMQSYTGNIFKQIKEKLDNDILVLFSGCPCQVAGLKSYLGKDYKNLILIDILCSYAPSPKFFKKYIEEAFPKGIEHYEFRHKSEKYNWDCVTVKITTADGIDKVYKGGGQDSYQRVFHNHVMCSVHCENCKYQTIPRFGDITIGDFWGIERRDTLIDAKKGVSVVLCNNDKAEKILKNIPKEKIGVFKEVPLSWLGGNGYANHGSNYSSPARDSFYASINKMEFSKAADYALKPNHGQINKIYTNSNTPLQFDSNCLRFKFDGNIWEQHTILGKPVLIVKPGMSKVGRYATLPLCKSLIKDKEYYFKIKFRIRTEAKNINFHIKDSGSNYYQIVLSYKLTGDRMNYDWIETKTKFKPNSNLFDEFMIGASQIRGEGNHISIDYINIEEC